MSDERRPILAVDDDESILEFVQMALEEEGCEVVLARDGAEALELVGNGVSPGLILLDMRMPNVNGWQFAEEYRKMHKSHAPIVVVTAGRDARDLASEVGACSYLGKPFDVDDLIKVVQGFVPKVPS